MHIPMGSSSCVSASCIILKSQCIYSAEARPSTQFPTRAHPRRAREKVDAHRTAELIRHRCSQSAQPRSARLVAPCQRCHQCSCGYPRLRCPFLDAAQRPVALTHVHTCRHVTLPFSFWQLLFSSSSFVADVQNDVARRVQPQIWVPSGGRGGVISKKLAECVSGDGAGHPAVASH